VEPLMLVELFFERKLHCLLPPREVGGISATSLDKVNLRVRGECYD